MVSVFCSLIEALKDKKNDTFKNDNGKPQKTYKEKGVKSHISDFSSRNLLLDKLYLNDIWTLKLWKKTSIDGKKTEDKRKIKSNPIIRITLCVVLV